MAGIGPRNKNYHAVLKQAGRSPELTDDTNELQIFYHLCVGRVYFRKSSNTLYFVDSPIISVTDIIGSVFKGLQQKPTIRQLYMDEHNLFNASFCVVLTKQQSRSLLVALRLQNIHIDT